MEKKYEDTGLQKIKIYPVFSDISGEAMVSLFFNEQNDQNLYKGMTISQAICNLFSRLGDALFSIRAIVLGRNGIKRFGLFKDIFEDINGIRAVIQDMVVQKKKKFIEKGKIPGDDMTENLFKYLEDNPDGELFTE